MLFNVPNLVTMSRIILIPLIIGLYYVPGEWLSLESKNTAAAATFFVSSESHSPGT